MRIGDTHHTSSDMHIYDPEAPRKATNVSVNTDLLRAARAVGLNLSRVLEERLIEVIRERRCVEWIEENRDAIAAYNDRVEVRGAFGDDMRRF